MDSLPLLDSDSVMPAETPFVYIILGAAGSGRREVLADLIANGLPEDACPAVLLSAAEAADPSDAQLVPLGRWTWREGAIDAALPPEATHVFFVTDGRQNPVDQMEALQKWLPAVQAEIGRVITVVNCRLAEQHPPLIAWYEACIHFSDVALLNQREGVANKWMSEFQLRFKELCYPCLFEFIKAGRVKNPLVVLDPQARRMSHIFDIDEWTGLDLEGVEFGTEDENGDEVVEDQPEKKAGKGKAAEDDDDDWKPQIDPYFKLRLGGRRELEIPDIGKFLP